MIFIIPSNPNCSGIPGFHESGSDSPETPHLTTGPSERSLTSCLLESLLCIFHTSPPVSPGVLSDCLDLSCHKRPAVTAVSHLLNAACHLLAAVTVTPAVSPGSVSTELSLLLGQSPPGSWEGNSCHSNTQHSWALKAVQPWRFSCSTQSH